VTSNGTLERWALVSDERVFTVIRRRGDHHEILESLQTQKFESSLVRMGLAAFQEQGEALVEVPSDGTPSLLGFSKRVFESCRAVNVYHFPTPLSEQIYQ